MREHEMMSMLSKSIKVEGWSPEEVTISAFDAGTFNFVFLVKNSNESKEFVIKIPKSSLALLISKCPNRLQKALIELQKSSDFKTLISKNEEALCAMTNLLCSMISLQNSSDLQASCPEQQILIALSQKDFLCLRTIIEQLIEQGMLELSSDYKDPDSQDVLYPKKSADNPERATRLYNELNAEAIEANVIEQAVGVTISIGPYRMSAWKSEKIESSVEPNDANLKSVLEHIDKNHGRLLRDPNPDNVKIKVHQGKQYFIVIDPGQAICKDLSKSPVSKSESDSAYLKIFKQFWHDNLSDYPTTYHWLFSSQKALELGEGKKVSSKKPAAKRKLLFSSESPQQVVKRALLSEQNSPDF